MIKNAKKIDRFLIDNVWIFIYLPKFIYKFIFTLEEHLNVVDWTIIYKLKRFWKLIKTLEVKIMVDVRRSNSNT